MISPDATQFFDELFSTRPVLLRAVRHFLAERECREIGGFKVCVRDDVPQDEMWLVGKRDVKMVKIGCGN